MDNYFDAFYNILVLNDDSFITYSYSLENTDVYEQFKDFICINLLDNFEEYFKLWKNAFDRFYSYFKENCSDTILIINCSRGVYKYSENGSILKNPRLERECLLYNRYMNILDKYILENYDVEVLPFDYDTLADKNHIFGFERMHYEPEYYSKMNHQLNEIIKFNTMYEYGDDIYADFRKLKRENEIHKMELYELKELKIPKLKNNNKVLKEKYSSISNSNSGKLTKTFRKIKKFNK